MDKAGCLTQHNGMRPGPDTEAAGYGLGTIITVAGHLTPLLAARVLRRAQQEGGSSVIKVSLRGERSACLDRLQRGRAPVVAAVSRQERTAHCPRTPWTDCVQSAGLHRGRGVGL